jgi:hypothetical protein
LSRLMLKSAEAEIHVIIYYHVIVISVRPSKLLSRNHCVTIARHIISSLVKIHYSLL